MKVIFLDVDGVLNHRGSFASGMPGGSKRIAPECVAVLNSIIERTGADIVVSSTWRGDPNYVRVLRDAGVRGRIIGRTPDSARKIEGTVLFSSCRGEEIQQWITENGVDQFVILDDDSDMAHLLPRLVQTSFDGGLTPDHADRAVGMLNDPPAAEGTGGGDVGSK